MWNRSRIGWRLSGDLPMRPGGALSLTVMLPNEQRFEVPEAVKRWSRGEEFAVETVKIEQHTQARLQHYVKRSVEESVGDDGDRKKLKHVWTGCKGLSPC